MKQVERKNEMKQVEREKMKWNRSREKMKWNRYRRRWGSDLVTRTDPEPLSIVDIVLLKTSGGSLYKGKEEYNYLPHSDNLGIVIWISAVIVYVSGDYVSHHVNDREPW